MINKNFTPLIEGELPTKTALDKRVDKNIIVSNEDYDGFIKKLVVYPSSFDKREEEDGSF